MKQKEAFKILQAGHNVLLTGPAGSGKTFLLNKYITELKENKVGVAITASTGIAATHIGGRTIHSWAGIGIKDKMSASQIAALTKRAYLRRQFEKTTVLVIDEVSMLDAKRLDLINSVCQAFKRSTLPFGGIQLIMSGDFFQLPPISSSGGEEVDFVYKAKIWNQMDLKVCYLDEQHRQNDKKMSAVLESLREDKVSAATNKLLASRLNKKPKGKHKPVRLFSHNVDVDLINKLELDKINSEEQGYEMKSEGDKRLLEALQKNSLVPEYLSLKIGALVMFVRNKFKDERVVYVNGTTGEIVGFDENNYPIVALASGAEVVAYPESWTIDDDDKVLAKITQVPLRLAWAITIHKSQGMTLSSAEIDLSRSFGYGMGYVALSRLKNLDGLYLLGINEMAYKINPQVLAYDKKLLALSKKARTSSSAKNKSKE